MKLQIKQQSPVAVPVSHDKTWDSLRDPARTLIEMREAQVKWGAVSLRERLRVIGCFRHLLAEGAEDLLEGFEPSSRPAAEALASEIIPLADACRFLEREAQSILAPRRVGSLGRPLWLFGETAVVKREAHGVVLIIAPSNYPVFLPGVQLVQALAAGNAVLLKPGSNGTPCALRLARLLVTVGLPPSLVRVLPEAPDAVRVAIDHGVDKVVFTGSAAVGAEVLSRLAPQAVPSTMELSGCDAAIVRGDADLELAVRALVFGLRLNSGQTCIAPKRVLVERSMATEFEGRLSRALAECPPVPMLSRDARRLLPLVRQAIADGAHLLWGRELSDSTAEGPIVLAGISGSCRLLQEDLWGPIACLITVRDDEEAIALANQSRYALGTTIFSRDIWAAQDLAGRVNAGVVVINDMIAPTADPRLPFGGRGLSGFGVTRGREGLLEMTRTKVVVSRAGRSRPHFEESQGRDKETFLHYLGAFHGRGFKSRWVSLFRLAQSLAKREVHRQQHCSTEIEYENT